MSARGRGFTLVEILAALAIFAIMAIASYRGLAMMLDAREHIGQENARWRSVALFFSRLENDLEAFLDRPVRGTSDLLLPSLKGSAMAYGEDDAQLAFTRSGFAGPGGALSAPQRVGYRLRGEAIEYLTWDALDQAPRSRPEVSHILEEVTRFELRFLDRNGNWQTQWPLPDREPGLPAAVEARLSLRSGEELVRMIALP